MCGRFENRNDPRFLVERYGLKAPLMKYQSPAEYAPTMIAPVILGDEQGEIRLMKWGLIPSWAKDPKFGVKCFNAKSETVAEKPAFRDSFRRRRCLVPVSAFFEWREEEENNGIQSSPPLKRKPKRKYRFNVTDDEIFSLASLWASWRSPAGDVIESFTILTTQPNELVAAYHDRMPVILSRDDEKLWLSNSNLDAVQSAHLFQPFNRDRMSVSPAG